MKLWAFFFALWLVLCGLGYMWLHPQTTSAMGILPGDLPVESIEVTPLESTPEIEVIPIETH